MNGDDPKYQTGEPDTPSAQPPDVIISPDTFREDRIPPGQTRTRKWPVLQWGRIPIVRKENWSLTVGGEVARTLHWNWDEFRALPRVRVFADFHCVTRWSRLGNIWEGVSVKHLAELAGILPSARFVVATGYDDGWTTNMPLADFNDTDCIIADTHDGVPLDADHGGPVRLIIPKLYAWKSAKWLKKLTFLTEDCPGLWEKEGYHLHGDPWTEERFRDDL